MKLYSLKQALYFAYNSALNHKINVPAFLSVFLNACEKVITSLLLIHKYMNLFCKSQTDGVNETISHMGDKQTLSSLQF